MDYYTEFIVLGNNLYAERDGDRRLLASYLREQITDPEYDRALFIEGCCDGFDTEIRALDTDALDARLREIEDYYNQK